MPAGLQRRAKLEGEVSLGVFTVALFGALERGTSQSPSPPARAWTEPWRPGQEPGLFSLTHLALKHFPTYLAVFFLFRPTGVARTFALKRMVSECAGWNFLPQNKPSSTGQVFIR
jgi:hypothetical protein